MAPFQMDLAFSELDLRRRRRRSNLSRAPPGPSERGLFRLIGGSTKLSGEEVLPSGIRSDYRNFVP